MAGIDLPASSDPGEESAAPSFLQTKLEQHGFKAVPRRPCWINRLLPAELIMEIFAYLPTVDDCLSMRVHAKPWDIPIHHTDYVDEDEDEEENEIKILVAQDDCGYGECIAEALFPDGCTKYCSSGHWNYMDVLRVCRFWHSSAESSPHFWAHIPSHSLGMVQRSLKLSGALPLFAVADYDRQWPSELAFTTVLEHLPRICVLDVTYATRPGRSNVRRRRARWHVGEVLKPFRSLPAPRLRVLRLLHWSDKTLDTEYWVEKSFPSLEVLELRGFEIASPCALFVPTLTELILSDCIAPWTSTDQLLRCLSRMPRLRQFNMQGTPLPLDLDHDNFPSPAGHTVPVPLAHLRHLWLDGSFRCINRLLSILGIPAGKTSLYLSFEGGYRHEDHADRQKTHDLISSFPAAMPSGAYFSSIDLDLDFETRFVDLTLSDLVNSSDSPCVDKIQLTIEWNENEDTRARKMIRFLLGMTEPFLASSRQTRLSYSQSGFYTGVNRWLGPEKYISWLEGLTDVSAVRLSNKEGAGTFLEWMMNKWRQGALPFTAPKRLSLCNVDLREKFYATMQHAQPGPDHILYVRLWLYLHHYKPGSLSLMSVLASPRMLAELKRLVHSLDTYNIRRVQERERFEVYRDHSNSSELLFIWEAEGAKGQRHLLRRVDAPRTRMFWEREKTVTKDVEEPSET
ncbi:hypothetical protein PENSPDRAFT_169879 [Peniophora sp. CONT]|nr:hypothetical protein PENSPDRAFT_169879 [Peniophora sp. CONT]